MLARRGDSSPDSVSDELLRRIKRVVTKGIAPLTTGILTDPLYGYPASLDVLPPDIGVLLSREVTGYSVANGQERRTRLLDTWNPARALQEGADAMKLLLYHHPEASPETCRHQEALVETVGAACADVQLPFVLEVLTYPLEDAERYKAAFLRDKPDLVAKAAAIFSAPRFQVDVLKLEFPAPLKYARGYQATSFGTGTVLYEDAEVQAACERLDAAADVPWVILSAGVGIREFEEGLRLANEAGASGFLCGRAVWKEVVACAPHLEQMQAFVEEDGRSRFERIREVNETARPWMEHPHFQDGLPIDERFFSVSQWANNLRSPSSTESNS